MNKSVDSPFTAVFLIATGERVEFRIPLDVAQHDVRRFIIDLDPRMPALDRLDDREVLLEGLLRFYARIARNAVGTFFMDDPDGRPWVIPARNVVAFFLEDPHGRDRHLRRRELGFRRDRDVEPVMEDETR